MTTNKTSELTTNLINSSLSKEYNGIEFTKLISVAGLFSHSVFQVFVLFFTTTVCVMSTFGCHLSPADTSRA